MLGPFTYQTMGTPYIDCSNKYESWQDLFRKMVLSDGDGQPFLYTNTDPDGPALRTDAPGGGVTYYGYAPIGTTSSAAEWKIKKVTVSGTVTITEYADGDLSFDNVWDDRAALTYA